MSTVRNRRDQTDRSAGRRFSMRPWLGGMLMIIYEITKIGVIYFGKEGEEV